MKRFMEKASILALSFVLTTAFSISSALPAMSQFYKNYSSSQVELLVSLPSIGIMSLLLFTRTIVVFYLWPHPIFQSSLWSRFCFAIYFWFRARDDKPSSNCDY